MITWHHWIQRSLQVKLVNPMQMPVAYFLSHVYEHGCSKCNMAYITKKTNNRAKKDRLLPQAIRFGY